MPEARLLVTRLFGSKGQGDEATSTLRVYRFVLGLTAVMIKVFGVVYYVIEPSGTDPLWARFAFAGVPLGALVFSYQSGFVRAQLSRFYRACAYLIVLWFTVLTYVNGFSPEYALGLLFVNAVTSAGYGVGLREIDSAATFLVFSILVPIGGVWWAPDPAVSPLLLSTCIVCLAGIVFPALKWHVEAKFEIEEAVREAAEAEEANKLKTALLANVTHEIRSPVASMIGYADTLEEEIEGPASMLTERIRESGQRLLATVNSVLEISKMESGSTVMNPVEFNLVPKVRSTVLEVERQRDASNVELSCELPEDPLRVWMDADAVRRIVRNLVDNAVKFTQSGTVVVGLWSEGDEIVLEVEDEGIGISPEFQDRIFLAFEQESSGLTRDFGGVGLGLSITQRIVERAGGHIGVVSEKGQGSTFTVRLPRDWDIGRKTDEETASTDTQP